MTRRLFLLVAFVFIFAHIAAAEPTAKLSADLKPFLSILDGATKQSTLTADVKFNIGKDPQQATIAVARSDDQTFSLSLQHEKYPLILLRDANRTVLALPAKQVLFLGEGQLRGEDVLSPDGVVERLLSDGCAASTYYTVIAHANSYVAALTLTKLAGLHSEDGSVWTAKSLGGAKITFAENAVTVEQGANSI